MQEISRARTGEYYRTLLEVLLLHADGMEAKDAIQEVADRIDLSEHELEVTASGVSRFKNAMHFGSTALARAGWIAKPSRGEWVITPDGVTAVNTIHDPRELYLRSEQLRNAAKLGMQPSEAVAGPDGEETTEIGSVGTAIITRELAEERAWAVIEAFLRNMPPYEFQELVACLLRGMGYHVDHVSPPGKDGGIDIVAFTDPLGTRPPRIKVQVKRWESNIDVKGVREFVGLLGPDDLGLFVTTSGFTKDAKDEARAQQNRKVTLIDLKRFFSLWVEHRPKLDDAARRRFPLQPIYFLAPAN